MKNEKKSAGAILKKETKLMVYVVTCMVLIVIGSSYALFFQVGKGTKNQVVQAGSLKFVYGTGTTITSASKATCFEPKTEAEAAAMTECSYELSVQNSGTLASSYQLRLLTNAENTLATSKVKVILKKQNGAAFTVVSGYPKVLSTLSDGTLITETIAPSTTVVYSVQVFADSSLIQDTDDGKVLSLSINGVGEVDETGIGS